MTKKKCTLLCMIAVAFVIFIVHFFLFGFGVHFKLKEKVYPFGTTAITGTWYNFTKNIPRFGNYFRLELLQNGQWVVQEEEDMGRVTLGAYPVFPFLPKKHTYLLSAPDGPPLAEGQYRMIHDYSFDLKNAAPPHESFILYAYFTIGN